MTLTHCLPKAEPAAPTHSRCSPAGCKREAANCIWASVRLPSHPVGSYFRTLEYDQDLPREGMKSFLRGCWKMVEPSITLPTHFNWGDFQAGQWDKTTGGSWSHLGVCCFCTPGSSLRDLKLVELASQPRAGGHTCLGQLGAALSNHLPPI